MRLPIVSLIALLLAFQSGCSDPKGNEILTVEQSEGVIVNDVGEARFPTPAGWAPNRSDGNTAVILTRVDANPQDRDEMISIDIGTPVSPDTKASAEGFAGKFSGSVTPLPFAVDGEQAYRVSIPANYEQLMPRECIVVHHAGKVCFLIGGSKSKADIWPTLKEVAESWTWK